VRRKVIIAGGNGFLGRGLSEAMLALGDEVVALCRPGREGLSGTRTVAWDAKNVGSWAEELDGADVVVNLVGRSVDCRKTPENRREIMDSRVDSTRVLGKACVQADNPPSVWLQMGTAHIYGDPLPEDTLIVEDSPIGEGLAPEVGLAWEQAFHESKLPEQRGVISRTSFVLGKDRGGGGGALDRLLWLVKRGLGGTVGSGRQYISWVHEDDQNAFWLKAMADETMSGFYIVTAPEPVTNTGASLLEDGLVIGGFSLWALSPYIAFAFLLGLLLVLIFLLSRSYRWLLNRRRAKTSGVTGS